MFQSRTVFVMLGIAILALFVISCSSGGTTTNNVTVVNLEVTDSGCTPKNIDTAQGFLLKLSFKNSGTAEATFNVPDVPFTLIAPPGQTALGNFTAPTAPGKYNFTCGSGSNPTRGEIQVKSN